MKKKILIIFSIGFLLISCASMQAQEIDTDKLINIVKAEDEVKVVESEKTQYVFLPIEDEKLNDLESENKDKDTIKDEKTPTSLLKEANKRSEVEIYDKTFLKSNIVEYLYNEGNVYTIITSPKFVTDFRLEKNEVITSDVAIGSPESFSISAVTHQEDGQSYNHLFIQPLTSNLETTMIIPTNKRMYYLKLKSYEDTYMIAIRFKYPIRNSLNKVSVNQNNTLKLNTKINDLDYDYQIKQTKGWPEWKPAAVFSDGKKTYIAFNSSFNLTNFAPALYLVRDNEDIEIATYSLKANMYIVNFILQKNDTLVLTSGDQQVHIGR